MLYGENFCFSDLIPEFSIRAIFALEVLDGCASKGKQQKLIRIFHYDGSITY